MQIVEGTFINDTNIYVTIKSNTAIYNIKNHKTSENPLHNLFRRFIH